MSQSDKGIEFDPYHKWLAIPKAQRPPTHYQLLGLAQGEPDSEVIEEAAIRQTTHIRAYQVGPHAELCTRLLNEIALARQVLTNPQKRRDYDKKLAQSAAKKAAALQAQAVAAPVEGAESAFADLGGDADIAPAKPRRDANAGRPPVPREAASKTTILAAAVGGIVVIIGLIALAAFWPKSPTPAPPVAANIPPKSVAPAATVIPPPKQPAVEPKPQIARPAPPPVIEPKEPAVEPKLPLVEPPPIVKEPDPVPPLVSAPKTDRSEVVGSWALYSKSPRSSKLDVVIRKDADDTFSAALALYGPKDEFIGISRTAGNRPDKDGTLKIVLKFDRPLPEDFDVTELRVHRFTGTSGVSKGRNMLMGQFRPRAGAGFRLDLIEASEVPSALIESLPAVAKEATVKTMPKIDNPAPMKTPEIVQKAPTIAKGGLLATYGFAGKWHAHIQLPPTDLDMEIRGEGANQSLLLTISQGGRVGKAHCDRVRLGANGRLFCSLTIDAPLPGVFDMVTEAEFYDAGRDSLRSAFRVNKSSTYAPTFSRVDAPQPAPVAKTERPAAPEIKSDVPDEAKVKEVEATVRDNFKADYAKKTPADRIALAEKLLQLGDESADDAVARFVLYSEARTIAAAAGKWSVTQESLDRLDAGFKIDALSVREQTLQSFVKTSLGREAAVEATDAAMSGAKAALAQDRLPLADGFLALAAIAAAKTASVPHISAVKKAEIEMKLVNQEAEAAARARETLKTSPDDAAANLELGRYEALRRQDWTRALPLLAKGGEAELAVVARKEQEKPGDAAAPHKIGDDYWNLAEKEKSSAWVRSALQARAGHWYRIALPQLSGLGLALVNERLKTLDELKVPQQNASVAVELKVLKGHSGAISGLLLADGDRLLSSGLDGNLIFWDMKLGKNVGAMKSPVGPIVAFSLSPSNRKIAISGKTLFRNMDVDTLAPTPATGRYFTFPVAPGSFWSHPGYVFTMNATEFRWVSEDGGGTAGIRHSIRFHQLAPAPDRKRFVTIGADTELHRLVDDIGRLNMRGRLPIPAESTCAAFATNSQNMLIGSVDKKITLVDTDQETAIKTFEGSNGIPRCLAFTPDGERFLSGGDDGTIRIWEIATGKEIARFASGSKTVTAMALSTDGRQLFSGGIDGVIRVWSLSRDKTSSSKDAAGPP